MSGESNESATVAPKPVQSYRTRRRRGRGGSFRLGSPMNEAQIALLDARLRAVEALLQGADDAPHGWRAAVEELASDIRRQRAALGAPPLLDESIAALQAAADAARQSSDV